MRVLNGILFLTRPGPGRAARLGSRSRAVMNRFRRSFHEPKAVGGGRPTQPSQHGLRDVNPILSLQAPTGLARARVARATKLIIPMNFAEMIGQILAA